MTAVAAPTAAPTTHVGTITNRNAGAIAGAGANPDADASALLSFLLPEVEEQRVSDLLVEEINKAGNGSQSLEIPDHPPSLSSSILREHNDLEDLDALQVIENPLDLSPLHESSFQFQFPPSPNSPHEKDLDENDLDDIIHSLERDNILLTPPVTPASATALGVDFLPFIPIGNEPGLSAFRKMSAQNPLSDYHSNCSIFITPTFRTNGGRGSFGHKRKRSDFKLNADKSASDTVLVLPPPRRRKSEDQGHKDTDKEIDALFEEPEQLIPEGQDDNEDQDENKDKDSTVVDIYDGLSDCSDTTDETLSIAGDIVEPEEIETGDRNNII